jgi:hypothetical protein
MNGGENIVKWIKGQRISWLGHLERMEENRMPQKIFTQELEGTRRRGRPRKKMERGSRKRSSSVRSEKMERVGEMEGYYSTGQRPQRAVVPMEKRRRRKRPGRDADPSPLSSAEV